MFSRRFFSGPILLRFKVKLFTQFEKSRKKFIPIQHWTERHIFTRDNHALIPAHQSCTNQESEAKPLICRNRICALATTASKKSSDRNKGAEEIRSPPQGLDGLFARSHSCLFCLGCLWICEVWSNLIRLWGRVLIDLLKFWLWYVFGVVSYFGLITSYSQIWPFSKLK